MAENPTEYSFNPTILAQRGFRNCVRLGKGSFGEVFKAECQDDGMFSAIKVLPLINRTKYIKRELELLLKLKLSNPNVIKYFKSWVMQDNSTQILCIQMELCSVDLATFIYANNMDGAEIIKAPGPPRFYKQIFPQILNGLIVIHSIGWVHRDIHLGNILIVNPNPQQIGDIHVKIADFGLARYIGMEFEMSANMTVVPTLEKLSPDIGNVLFMAPEISTENYDFKVDVFSSGIVLYLLSCYLPNRLDVREEIIALREGRRSAIYLHHQDDHRLFQLIEWLLQKNPSNRPTAAEALAYTQTRDHTDSTMKWFVARRSDDDTYYRCSSNDATLSSIQDAIERHSHLGIEKDAQILKEEKPMENGRLFGITCDEDVRKMFESAEKKHERVIIVVSERERGNMGNKLLQSKHYGGMPQ